MKANARLFSKKTEVEWAILSEIKVAQFRFHTFRELPTDSGSAIDFIVEM